MQSIDYCPGSRPMYPYRAVLLFLKRDWNDRALAIFWVWPELWLQ